jgi:uncharacterized tellurite resistance protein B-like protein
MDQRVAKCLLVSQVLVADGIMTENERAFLDALMARLQLSEAERKRVIDLEGWDEAEPIAKALTMEERREIIAMMVDAASSDGRLSPLENQAVKRISKALGVR